MKVSKTYDCEHPKCNATQDAIRRLVELAESDRTLKRALSKFAKARLDEAHRPKKRVSENHRTLALAECAMALAGEVQSWWAEQVAGGEQDQEQPSAPPGTVRAVGVPPALLAALMGGGQPEGDDEPEPEASPAGSERPGSYLNPGQGYL